MGFMKLFLCLTVGALLGFGLLLAMTDVPRRSAWSEISADRMLENIKILSSDEYEGRAPASKGEKLATHFIEAQFKQLGLEPGNPDGTYFQNVPMVGITADPATELVFASPASGKPVTLKYADDFVAWTKRVEPSVSVDAEMVFVGYGIVAPEYKWDDYKGVDVKGKVLVMLINDPPVPDPQDPSQLDEKTFKGKAMTYYGRWTYKFEIAAEKGAAGCLIVHQTGPAGYPWGVVKSSNTGEQFSLVAADRGMSRSAVEGWMTQEKARELFAMTGRDFDTLEKAAVRRDFRPVDLGVKASLALKNRIRTIESKNVVARLEGSDPKLRDEYVIYTAHWDHLGIGPEINGDKIYHGALDNASGVAALLELGRAYQRLAPPPRRSILFLSVTAEEKGLLGSQYYAEHPLYPLAKTLAAINMDGLNPLGPTKDIEIIGLGQSTLDDVAKAVAAEQGRVVKPDAEPEKGFYYRSDHFNFAKQGVPALDLDSGVDYIGKPPGWGMEMRDKFTAEDYHKPSDKVKPYWDLRGAVEDLELLGEVGYRVANAKTFPTWKTGSEFRAKREEMLKHVQEH
ncbi:MAG: M28 family metallopeptidase [Terriglobia bacterium]|jgi:Zn-dependent M28 family amino/carboxypeptidase